ncbi:hypothetical protein SSBR45G_64030 [Bradyrhizobium sp. SSBR45G]|uniref:hypothetical protein n=1 Tax=unclassified Bradyrhizobium TaxID=2631580 RepID=UPI0023429C75|nr:MULTISPECIES: hypothetical protein [unclassified Bradyrhizobium]GLH81494.1 hypothetical protein SSBR45G_64030 [Bradyrhizobium sp. SSBR45G]GLH88901.1 hypothetical protein SSBR45R_63620 [Bradyrhizobium sp. SSBR45R]
MAVRLPSGAFALVLIVADDELLRDLAVQSVESAGFLVLQAGNARRLWTCSERERTLQPC